MNLSLILLTKIFLLHIHPHAFAPEQMSGEVEVYWIEVYKRQQPDLFLSNKEFHRNELKL
ncbi:MAG: hypothetical protein CNLJKLNK_01281 [Holosporales bacterium]